MARIFNIGALSFTREHQITGEGDGSYTFDLREASAERLFRMSTGLTLDTLRLMAGHFVVFEVKTGGRAYAVPEQFNEEDRDAVRAGSFNYSSLKTVFPRVQSNALFSYSFYCCDCNKRWNGSAHHVCGEMSCRECGEVLTADAEKRAGFCKRCQMERISRIHSYHGRVNRTMPLFEKRDKRDVDVHIGAEIEIDGEHRDPFEDEDARELSAILNKDPFNAFIEFEHDSSLDGGVECITAPTTFAGLWKRRDALKAFYDKARYLEGSFKRANGLHFHIDRAFFGFEEEERGRASVLIDMMVYKFYDFFKAISRRENDAFGYARKKEGVDGLYGAFANTRNQDHFYAVNGSGSNTIELRFFGGHIETGDDFLACADIVQAVARWAKGCTLAQAERATPCDVVKYVRKPENVLQFVENAIDERPITINGEEMKKRFEEALRARIARNESRVEVM